MTPAPEHPSIEARRAELVERASHKAVRALLAGATDLPFDPWRQSLYTVEELAEGADRGGYLACLDYRIYSWFESWRRHPQGVPLLATLAQRLHDHAIEEALDELLRHHSGRGVVGVMGGHGVHRDHPCYASVVRLGWELARAGYLVATGGGPGVMEAANLGAWLSCFADPAAITLAVEILAQAPRLDGSTLSGDGSWVEGIDSWQAGALEVTERLGPDCTRFRRDRPANGQSLAIPTWFYGHEPSNLFSTWVAKYFANSIREDGLLAIARAGVVYAPGSAGTLQEIFLDLAQNHYGTVGVRSPMIFLGQRGWSRLFDLVRDFVSERGMAEAYGDLLFITDDPEAAVDFVNQHPPRPVAPPPPLLPAR